MRIIIDMSRALPLLDFRPPSNRRIASRKALRPKKQRRRMSRL